MFDHMKNLTLFVFSLLSLNAVADSSIPSVWVPYTMPTETQKKIIKAINEKFKVTATLEGVSLSQAISELAALPLKESHKNDSVGMGMNLVFFSGSGGDPAVNCSWNEKPFFEALNELAEKAGYAWSIDGEGTMPAVVASIDYFIQKHFEQGGGDNEIMSSNKIELGGGDNEIMSSNKIEQGAEDNVLKSRRPWNVNMRRSKR